MISRPANGSIKTAPRKKKTVAIPIQTKEMLNKNTSLANPFKDELGLISIK